MVVFHVQVYGCLHYRAELCVRTALRPQYGKNWDTILNHLAFNINQLPCKTLGFSPHELMFGRNLRSQLETLKDEFLGNDAGEKAIKKNVIAFITDLQNRIHTANQLAKQHSEQEQKNLRMAQQEHQAKNL